MRLLFINKLFPADLLIVINTSQSCMFTMYFLVATNFFPKNLRYSFIIRIIYPYPMNFSNTGENEIMSCSFFIINNSKFE